MTISRYEVQCYDQEVNSWFSNAIARPCILWRSSASNCYLKNQESTGMCRDMGSSLSFVNEAQFLLISEASVLDLNNRLRSSMYLNRFISMSCSHLHMLSEALCLFVTEPVD